MALLENLDRSPPCKDSLMVACRLEPGRRPGGEWAVRGCFVARRGRTRQSHSSAVRSTRRLHRTVF